MPNTLKWRRNFCENFDNGIVNAYIIRLDIFILNNTSADSAGGRLPLKKKEVFYKIDYYLLFTMRTHNNLYFVSLVRKMKNKLENVRILTKMCILIPLYFPGQYNNIAFGCVCHPR